jgi:hypothetical protein
MFGATFEKLNTADESRQLVSAFYRASRACSGVTRPQRGWAHPGYCIMCMCSFHRTPGKTPQRLETTTFIFPRYELDRL